jgi:hypothetical protein
MSFPNNPTNGTIYKKYKFTMDRWEYSSIPTLGLLYSDPASSASDIKTSLSPYFTSIPNQAYWIKGARDSSPIQIYCENNINGGGWMSFASAPSSGNWFTGNTGAAALWSGLSYSYSTYSILGTIGDYWRNYSNQDITEVMFMTGNKLYWVSFPISYIVQAESIKTYTSGITTSNNFPSDTNYYNTSLSIYHRSAQSEDPWINVGNTHAVGNDYMFWGESGHASHITFKNANGGILVFVR